MTLSRFKLSPSHSGNHLAKHRDRKTEAEVDEVAECLLCYQMD